MMDDDCAKRSGTAAAQNYDHLNNMSADELLDQLGDVFDQMTEENFDPAVIDAYLDAMDEKEPMNISIDVEKEWEGFSRAHGLTAADTPRKRKVISFGRGRRLAVIAATIVIMMTLTVSAGALGFHYFWDKLEWDEEHFSFGDAQYSDEPQVANMPLFENWDEDKVYGSLQEALDDFGITEVAEPTWLPEGYEFDDASAYCVPEGDTLWIYAGYSNGEKQMTIAMEYAPPGEHHNTQYQVTDDPYEEYTIGDYTFLQFSNLKTKKILWLTPNYECSISGHLTFDELKMIVDSIYLEG